MSLLCQSLVWTDSKTCHVWTCPYLTNGSNHWLFANWPGQQSWSMARGLKSYFGNQWSLPQSSSKKVGESQTAVSSSLGLVSVAYWWIMSILNPSMGPVRVTTQGLVYCARMTLQVSFSLLTVTHYLTSHPNLLYAESTSSIPAKKPKHDPPAQLSEFNH